MTEEQTDFHIGWAGRFPNKQTYLTRHDFEVRRWRQLGYPTWPVFTKGEPHSSDCAMHNGPALEVGPCDCGALTYPAMEGTRSGKE